MSDLDAVARLHAEAVRSALADVVPPPVSSLDVSARPARRRGLIVVAIAAAVAVVALLPLVLPGDGISPTGPAPASVPPVGGVDQTPNTQQHMPSPELRRFDVTGFLDDKLHGAFQDMASQIAVVALVPVGSEQDVEALVDRLSSLGLEGFTYVPPAEVAASADRFAARNEMERLGGGWGAFGFIPELVDSPVGEWEAVLREVPGVIVSDVAFELPEVALEEGWDVVTDLPFVVGGAGFALPVDEGVVLIGANGTWKVDVDGTWTEGPASPIPTPAPCCEQGLLAGNQLVLAAEGGDTMWVLDRDTSVWRQTDPRPSTGFILGSAVIDEELVVVDAAPRARDSLTRVAALDLASLAWRELEPLPSPVSVGGVTSDGERVIVAGTWQDGNNNIGGQHVAYAHTEASGWQPLPNVPISGQASTVAWIDGAGLLAWNYDLQSVLLDEAGEWRPVGEVPMDPAECYPQTTVVAGGAVGVCGGLAWFDAANEQWAAIPTTDRYWGGTPAVVDDAVLAFIELSSHQTRMVMYPLPPNGG